LPKIFEYFGFVFFFYSNEYEPIHVHVILYFQGFPALSKSPKVSKYQLSQLSQLCQLCHVIFCSDRLDLFDRFTPKTVNSVNPVMLFFYIALFAISAMLFFYCIRHIWRINR